MHPAASIIVFTVFSGIGLGMMAWLGAGYGPVGGAFPWFAAGLALLLTAVGGMASVGHLAKPEAARFAFSQWRSSWLSREACLMVATLAVFTVWAGLWSLGGLRIRWLGVLAAISALATVYATSMIYAQLRTVPRWSATPTPALFLALALAGGLLGLETVTALAGAGGGGWAALAMAGAGGVWVWWQTSAAGAGRASQGSSMETATGLGLFGRVRLLEAPHTSPNYLLREMAFVVGRRRAFQLRLIGGLGGFILPLLLALLATLAGAWLLTVALLLHVIGMLALRWLFFAEAEHVQALYYGQQ